MVKTAVIFANGCEEIEGLSIVDILRRLNIECTRFFRYHWWS